MRQNLLLFCFFGGKVEGGERIVKVVVGMWLRSYSRQKAVGPPKEVKDERIEWSCPNPLIGNHEQNTIFPVAGLGADFQEMSCEILAV